MSSLDHSNEQDDQASINAGQESFAADGEATNNSNSSATSVSSSSLDPVLSLSPPISVAAVTTPIAAGLSANSVVAATVADPVDTTPPQLKMSVGGWEDGPLTFDYPTTDKVGTLGVYFDESIELGENGSITLTDNNGYNNEIAFYSTNPSGPWPDYVYTTPGIEVYNGSSSGGRIKIELPWAPSRFVDDQRVDVQSINFEPGTEYQLTFSDDAIKDQAGNYWQGLDDGTTLSFKIEERNDEDSPVWQPDYNLSNNAQYVDTSLEWMPIEFNEAVERGSGYITLSNGSDDVRQIDVSDAEQLSIEITDGDYYNFTTDVRFKVGEELKPNESYFVLIDETAIKDISGNYYAGIQDPTEWNFSTEGIDLEANNTTAAVIEYVHSVDDPNNKLASNFSNSSDVDWVKLIVEEDRNYTIAIKNEEIYTNGSNSDRPTPTQGAAVFELLDSDGNLLSGEKITTTEQNLEAGTYYAQVSWERDHRPWNAYYELEISADATPPLLYVASTNNKSNDVDPKSRIEFSFDDQVFAGSGNLIISNDNGDTIEIDINDPDQVTIKNNLIVVNPSSPLRENAAYTIGYGKGVILDGTRNSAALENQSALKFNTGTTKESTAQLTHALAIPRTWTGNDLNGGADSYQEVALYFDQSLSRFNDTPLDAFNVNVNGEDVALKSYRIVDNVVYLKTDTNIETGQTLQAGYTQPQASQEQLQSITGNNIGSIANTNVSNEIDHAITQGTVEPLTEWRSTGYLEANERKVYSFTYTGQDSGNIEPYSQSLVSKTYYDSEGLMVENESEYESGSGWNGGENPIDKMENGKQYYLVVGDINYQSDQAIYEANNRENVSSEKGIPFVIGNNVKADPFDQLIVGRSYKHDLGKVTGEQSYGFAGTNPYLTLYQDKPDKYLLTFETDATAEHSINLIRDDFIDENYLSMELSDIQGNSVASVFEYGLNGLPRTSGDFATKLELDGITAGKYLLEINHSTNADKIDGIYGLHFDAPPPLTIDQADEEGSSHALQLGSVDENTILLSKAINDATDVDRYRFSIDQDTKVNEVVLEFDHSQADLQLALHKADRDQPIYTSESDPYFLSKWNGSEYIIPKSFPVAESDWIESISLANLPQGSYDLVVSSPNNEAGFYDLSFKPTASKDSPEWYESYDRLLQVGHVGPDNPHDNPSLRWDVDAIYGSGNDTLKDAVYLGELKPGQSTLGQFSINTSDDVDYYIYKHPDDRALNVDRLEVKFNRGSGPLNVIEGGIRPHSSQPWISQGIDSQRYYADTHLSLPQQSADEYSEIGLQLTGLDDDSELILNNNSSDPSRAPSYGVIRVSGVDGATNSYTIEAQTSYSDLEVNLKKDKEDQNNVESIIDLVITENDRTMGGTGNRVVTGKTIDNANDIDKYKFSLLAEGTAQDFVFTDLAGLKGQEVNLLEADGTTFIKAAEYAKSTGSGSYGQIEIDSRTIIPLDGLAAGDYVVELKSDVPTKYSIGIGEHSNIKEYTQEIFGADVYDSNNLGNQKLENAVDLGVISDGFKLSNLTLHSAEDIDYYKFQVSDTTNNNGDVSYSTDELSYGVLGNNYSRPYGGHAIGDYSYTSSADRAFNISQFRNDITEITASVTDGADISIRIFDEDGIEFGPGTEVVSPYARGHLSVDEDGNNYHLPFVAPIRSVGPTESITPDSWWPEEYQQLKAGKDYYLEIAGDLSRFYTDRFTGIENRERYEIEFSLPAGPLPPETFFPDKDRFEGDNRNDTPETATPLGDLVSGFITDLTFDGEELALTHKPPDNGLWGSGGFSSLVYFNNGPFNPTGKPLDLHPRDAQVQNALDHEWKHDVDVFTFNLVNDASRWHSIDIVDSSSDEVVGTPEIWTSDFSERIQQPFPGWRDESTGTWHGMPAGEYGLVVRSDSFGNHLYNTSDENLDSYAISINLDQDDPRIGITIDPTTGMRYGDSHEGLVGNDTFETATEAFNAGDIYQGVQDSTTGSLNHKLDDDWYKFSIEDNTEKTTIFVARPDKTYENRNNVDTFLLNADKQVLAEGFRYDNYRSEKEINYLNYLVEENLDPGEYYLKIQPNQAQRVIEGDKDFGDYTVNIQNIYADPLPADRFEHNDVLYDGRPYVPSPVDPQATQAITPLGLIHEHEDGSPVIVDDLTLEIQHEEDLRFYIPPDPESESKYRWNSAKVQWESTAADDRWNQAVEVNGAADKDPSWFYNKEREVIGGATDPGWFYNKGSFDTYSLTLNHWPDIDDNITINSLDGRNTPKIQLSSNDITPTREQGVWDRNGSHSPTLINYGEYERPNWYNPINHGLNSYWRFRGTTERGAVEEGADGSASIVLDGSGNYKGGRLGKPLGPGEYILQVGQGPRGDYSLEFNGPPNPIQGDKNDQRDVFDTAENAVTLDQSSNQTIYEDSTIHYARDKDYYKFILPRDGVASQSIEIVTEHESTQNKLQFAGGSDQLNLAGYSAGEHIISVVYDEDQGDFGSNPIAYSVIANNIAEDYHLYADDLYETLEDENGNVDLGVVDGILRLEDQAIILNDIDNREFTLTGDGSTDQGIGIRFDRQDGDLKLELVQKDNQQVIKTADSVAYAQPTDDEWISLEGLSAGTYQARVSGMPTNYDFELITSSDHLNSQPYYQNSSIENAVAITGSFVDQIRHHEYEPNTELGQVYDTNSIALTSSALRNSQGELKNLSFAEDNFTDYYKFSTVFKSRPHWLEEEEDYIQVDFWDQLGNIDLELLSSEGDEIIDYSHGFGNSERIDLLNLPADDYIIKIIGRGQNNNYSLHYDLPTKNLLQEANLNNSTTQEEIERALQQHKDDLAYEPEATRNGEELNRIKSVFKSFYGYMPTGIYNHQFKDVYETLSPDNREDWYKYTITDPINADKSVGAYLDYNSGDGRLRLEAFRLNPDDQTLNPIYSPHWERTRDQNVEGSGNGQEFISAGRKTPLAQPGTYYFRVSSYDHRWADGVKDVTPYRFAFLTGRKGQYFESERRYPWNDDINIEPLGDVYDDQHSNDSFNSWQDPDPFNFDDYNFELDQLIDSGKFVGKQQLTHTAIHDLSDRDIYQFSMRDSGNEHHYIKAEFDQWDMDLDLYLYDQNNKEFLQAIETEHGYKNGENTREANSPYPFYIDGSFSNSDNEVISLHNLPVGDYFLRAEARSQYYNSADYDLTFNLPIKTITADPYEINNSPETIFDLGAFTGTRYQQQLSIHDNNDVDYIGFETKHDGIETDFIKLDYIQNDGVLQFDLIDRDSQQLIASSTQNSKGSFLSLEDVAAGKYSIKVSGTDLEGPDVDNPDSNTNNKAKNNYQIKYHLPMDPDRKDAWQFLYYFPAYIDIDIHQTINYLEGQINNFELSDDVNFAVMWDQPNWVDLDDNSATGSGEPIKWNTVGRSLLRGDGHQDWISSDFEVLDEKSMGDPKTLTDFIKWANQQAPAENQALVIHGHSSGLQSIISDNEAGDHLYVEEVAESLEKLKQEESIDLEILRMDGCLTGTLELAYELKDSAQVTIGSEAISGVGSGRYATHALSLVDNPYQIGPQQLASSIVEDYKAGYRKNTLSAINTDDLDVLAAKISAFVDTTKDLRLIDRNRIEVARAFAAEYDISGPQPGNYTADLGSFMDGVYRSSKLDQTVRDAAREVFLAVEAAVINKSFDYRGSRGISIFYPQGGQENNLTYIDKHSKFIQDTQWDQFLKAQTGAIPTEWLDTPVNDWSAKNTVASGAFHLGRLSGNDIDIDSLAIDEGLSKYFKFTLVNTGEAETAIKLFSLETVDDLKDLQLNLYSTDDQSALELPESDAHTLNLAGLEVAEYLLEIKNNGLPIPNASLKFNLPNDPTPSFNYNNLENKAAKLGVISAPTLELGTTSPSSATEDGEWLYYNIETSALSGIQQNMNVEVNVADGAEYEAAILDSNNNVISTVTGTGSNSLDYLTSGSGEEYTLKFRQLKPQESSEQSALALPGASSTFSLLFTPGEAEASSVNDDGEEPVNDDNVEDQTADVRTNPDIASSWAENKARGDFDELDLDVELGYSLHLKEGTEAEQAEARKQLAVLGDSVDLSDIYQLDITAKSLAAGYNLETADITINFDPYLFNEIKASDITIGGQLPIANAVRIDNDVGTIRIAAASLGDLDPGKLYGVDQSGAGASIGADGAVLASIDLNFNELNLAELNQNSDGSIDDLSTPLFFGLSANQDETVFSTALEDETGFVNRDIKSLRDLGGDLAVDGTKVTLYEATINLEEQGDGLILSSDLDIGSYNSKQTNLLRSGDTISTTSTWTNLGNIEAQNIQVTGITNSNAELLEEKSYFAYQGIGANGDQVTRNSLNSGSFRSDTGAFDSTAQESGQLHAAIKITGAAGNVVDLGLGIASLKADGSDLFSNQKGSKNLITFQGDLNYDGRVSMKDLAYLNAGAARQQQASEDPDAVDANSDGFVDASVARGVDANFDGQISMEDLAVLDADWGQSLHQQPINGANGTQSSFTGSDQISWEQLDSQGTTGDAAWDNQAFKDQNAVEAGNDFVESLENPTAVGVIGADGNSDSSDNDIAGTEFQDPLTG
ncbi:clostripain-related cysteine peptidase [Prochlorococcus sp. MIT 1312]|uniref:clostripain-related cysteine peptidase n=1 Tax=Prochlorococcus sp. MIT 1312 TaxID=3082537 RepID=UPI0039B0ADC4